MLEFYLETDCFVVPLPTTTLLVLFWMESGLPQGVITINSAFGVFKLSTDL
jgi:hypothetical protein